MPAAWAARLTACRQQRGWSKRRFSAESGLSQGTIKRLEDGREVHSHSLTRAALALGISLNALLGASPPGTQAATAEVGSEGEDSTMESLRVDLAGLSDDDRADLIGEFHRLIQRRKNQRAHRAEPAAPAEGG